MLVFVRPKQVGDPRSNAPTQELWFRTVRNPQKYPALRNGKSVILPASKINFFHWHLLRSHVFETGGFDVMLGNPSWDTLRSDEGSSFQHTNPVFEFNRSPSKRPRSQDCLRFCAISAGDANRRTLLRPPSFCKESGRYSLFAPGNPGSGGLQCSPQFCGTRARLCETVVGRVQIVPDGFTLVQIAWRSGGNCLSISPPASARVRKHERSLVRWGAFSGKICAICRASRCSHCEFSCRFCIRSSMSFDLFLSSGFEPTRCTDP